jgi:hypothetical protein
MSEFKSILKSFKITIKHPGYQNLRDIDFWQLYSQEEALEVSAFTALYESKGLPTIVMDE